MANQKNLEKQVIFTLKITTGRKTDRRLIETLFAAAENYFQRVLLPTQKDVCPDSECDFKRVE